MQVGSEFQCEIEKTVLGGDGLARVGGEVVFLPRTLPGEKLIGRVTVAKKNFSRAEVVRFGVTNPHRIEAACPCFGRCPGCRYLHTDYAYETELKGKQLDDALTAAGLAPEAGVVLPPAAPEPSVGYRNKIVLHVHKAGRHVRLGYVAADNTTVTDIEQCPLAHPAINGELARVRKDNSFLHSLHEGMDVTFRHTAFEGVKFWRNRPPGNMTWLREETPFGQLSVPCGSFFQVNPAGAAILIEEFRSLLAGYSPSRVIDLYAGAGLFGCAAASAGVGEILAVESDPEAAAAAHYNLRRFGIADPRVIAGDAAEAFAAASPGAGTMLVVDPPRGGLSPAAVRAIVGKGPELLVYISCNPGSWIRDAVRLGRGGYRLRRLLPVNLFPRTEHFELFSFWTRPAKG